MGSDRNVSTAFCWSSSGDDVEWLCLIISSTVAADWCISILAVVVTDWRILILIVLTGLFSLTRPLWYQLVVVFLIVGIHHSGISIPLSLLILLG